MQQQLVELWEVQRRTVFFVTHSIEEALLIADRILVLGAHPAGIEAEVTVPFARPRDLFALRFDRDFGALSHDLWNRLRSDAAGPGGRENR
jgi:NitT/TauT family transport system ATP-binding protein